MRILLIAAVLVSMGFQASDTATAPPVLSELDSTRVKVLNLEIARVGDLYEIARRAQAEADHARLDAIDHQAALKAELERTHPGWGWNPEDGKWTKKKTN